MAKRAEHEIGGMSVRMSQEQADRWNSGDATATDLSSIYVAIPEPQNQASYITLRRAVNPRLEQDIARQMKSMPANRVGEWK